MKIYIYSTSRYGYMLDSVIKSLRYDMGNPLPSKFIEGTLVNPKGEIIINNNNPREVFPDGESYHRFDVSKVENSDVVIIGGTINDRETMELFDMGCSAVEHGAKSLTLVIPFYGYSTMEREVNNGETVKAKTRAILLSAIPRAPYGNKVMMVDLHQDGVLHYFEGGTRTVHLYGKPLIMEICKTVRGKSLSDKNFVLGSTDAGRAKWIESLANDMGVQCAIIIKRRKSGTETEIAGINADVKDKDVIIYDDMIRTGGSLIKAAAAYKNAGAANIYAVTTHGVLPGDSIKKLYDSGLFKKVVATDTHPGVFDNVGPSMVRPSEPFLEIKSIAPVIAKALDNAFPS